MRITIPFDEDAKVYLILMFKTIQGTPNIHGPHGELPKFWYLQWSRISAESFDHLHCHLAGGFLGWEISNNDFFERPPASRGLRFQVFDKELKKHQRGEEMLQNWMLHYKITLHHCVRTPAACHLGATVQHPPTVQPTVSGSPLAILITMRRELDLHRHPLLQLRHQFSQNHPEMFGGFLVLKCHCHIHVFFQILEAQLSIHFMNLM